jgi:hypothetical protein
MFVLTSWEEKSRYSLPSSSVTYMPCASFTIIGLMVDWADHEWKTEAFSRSMLVSAVRSLAMAGSFGRY